MLAALFASLALSVQPQSQEGGVVEKFAQASSFNVECKVDTVDIELDQAPEKVEDALEKSQILAHIGDVKTLEWAHVSQHYFSDVDGRAEEKILGTPGGDMGEFILALAAFEAQSGTTLTLESATGLMMELVKSMSRIKFYHMTSEHAHDNLTASSGCRNLDISDPPEEKKAALLKLLVEPDNVGCKHLKYLLKGGYGPDVPQPRIVELGIQAFHEVMWNKTFAGSEKLCYMMLKGPHKEKAFVNIQTAQHCNDQNLAPLISPQTCFNSMFVNHPEAITAFRKELADLFMADASKSKAMQTAMGDMYVTGISKTVAQILKGYPMFTVFLKHS